jgi:hypothetical protein
VKLTDPIDTHVLDVENLHHLQRGILSRLYTSSQAAYADLKPPELSGNSFNYHLRHVVKQGLIHQTDDGSYQLTPLGQLLVDNVSVPTMRLKLRPVMAVAIYLTSPTAGVLLYRSNREPARGFAGLPLGKLRLGDTMQNTLQRMVERRGLDFNQLGGLRQLGLANIRYTSGGELVSHRFVSVWAWEYSGPSHTNSSEHGGSFWSHHPLTEPNCLPEVAQVMNWDGQSVLEVSADLAR